MNIINLFIKNKFLDKEINVNFYKIFISLFIG